MGIYLPYSRCFHRGNASTLVTPPTGPQTITSRNFGIVWAPFNDKVGEMSFRTTVFQELRDYNFRNLRVRYKWYYQEESDNVFDFHRVAADFNDLIAANNATGKTMKLIIMLELNNIADNPAEHGTVDHVVPAYMVGNSTYDGGELQFQATHSTTPKFGYKAKVWNANVQVKHKRYITALIDYIKATPAWYDLFEGIGFTESSVVGLSPGAEENSYFVALRSLLAHMRTEVPTKMVFGGYNGPARQLYAAITHLPTIQGTLWGPDIFPDQIGYWVEDTRIPAVNRGCYVYMRDMNNIVKYLDVQPQDYESTASPTQTASNPSSAHIPEVSEHYAFAVTMGLHYFCLTRDNAFHQDDTTLPRNWQRALTFMNTSGPHKTLIHGGMNTVAPSTYL